MRYTEFNYIISSIDGVVLEKLKIESHLTWLICACKSLALSKPIKPKALRRSIRLFTVEDYEAVQSYHFLKASKCLLGPEEAKKTKQV